MMILGSRGQHGSSIFQNKSRKTKVKAATTDALAETLDDEENCDKYEVDHLELFSSLNLERPPVYDAEFKEKVSCLSSERKAQIVWLEKKHGPAKDLAFLKIRDVNLSVNWGSDREDLCPCILSTSWLWARGPIRRKSGVQIVDRLLTGEEDLMMQGFRSVVLSWPHHSVARFNILRVDCGI